MLENFSDLIYILPVLVISLTIHEYSHAYVSYLLGDNLAKSDGRLSLNPLKHIDPLGFIALIFFGFGWAKPVNIDPSKYKNPIRDTCIVSLAGPLSNFLLAFIGVLLCAFSIKIGGTSSIVKLFQLLVIYNVSLGVFNLFPIPPLDGSKIIAGVLPDKLYYSFLSLDRYGFLLIYALIIFFPDIFSAVTTPVLNFYNTILFKLI